MPPSVHFAFFASSLVSSHWNEAATYYRGIAFALAARGHKITFYEPDAYERQRHRDIADPPWADVVVYSGHDSAAAMQCLERAAKTADVLVKASGIGVYDRLLEEAVPSIARSRQTTIFWDVDAPATFERMRIDANDPFHADLPRYDMVLTRGGGERVVLGYESLGAHACIPVFDALDPAMHFPVGPDPRFAAKLGLLGRPDRAGRIEQFFVKAAARLPDADFLLAGSGWHDKPMPRNVRAIGGVTAADRNAFNVTPRAVLELTSDGRTTGCVAPGARVFEVAGAAGCLITDRCEGIETFLEPGREVLVADDGEHLASIVSSLSEERARIIGANARRRILAQHTYADRALQIESILLVKTGTASRLSA